MMKWSAGAAPLCVLLVAMPAFGAAPIVRSTLQASPLIEVKPVALSIEGRLQLVERRMQALTDILMRLDRIQQEIQQLRGDVELQGHNLELLKKRQRDLYSDIDRRMMQLTTKQPPVVAPAAEIAAEPRTPLSLPAGAASPASQVTSQEAPVKERSAPSSTAAVPAAGEAPVAVASTADPALEQPLYKQAFDLLMQRRYEEAKEAFRAFLRQYPNGSLAANAQYWVGEASYVTRDFATALDEFTKVVQNYPDSTKVPDSLLKIAFIQYEQKAWAEARKTLERVTEQYASSTAARLALKRLERMRIEGN
ncbi:MAG: tol-pal system protein YbgF [Candidatus Polarisedimenticolaceae bacterium]|nr:tol-pal system protein YbgF [Candidatus Polarisedimenticolaceae bacterium]